MNWPDYRAVGRWLLGRRARGRSVRAFDAGELGRLTADWSLYPIPIDQAVKTKARALRARSRDQYRNNAYARRFVGMAKSNIIGPHGVKLQSRAVKPDLQSPDAATRAAIESAWRKWGTDKTCDYQERLSWRAAENLFVMSAVIDGEVIIRLWEGSAYGPFGFAFEFIDPELLDIGYNEGLKNGTYIRMGVEFDTRSRPVAYHFHDINPAEDAYSSYRPKHKRIPAHQIIHAFITEAPGQSRGLPWMSTVLMALKMLGAYEDAAIVAARVGAAKMGIIVEEEADAYEGTDKTDDGKLLEDVEPGTFGRLKNATLQSWNPEYPKDEFDHFVARILKRISSGVGVSYPSLGNSYEAVNFSSLRAATLEEREAWKSLQEWTVESFHAPIFHRFMQVQAISSGIKIPSSAGVVESLDSRNEVLYLPAHWQPRRWDWVDPLKDITALKHALSIGQKSLSEAIRERGRDPEEVWREIRDERSLLASLGLSFDPPAAESSMGSKNVEPVEEKDDGT